MEINGGLPAPSANKIEYDRIMKQGFLKYPRREENYKKYLKMIEEGYKETVDFMPVKMDYEAGSRCNFRCTMCLMSEISDRRPPEMSFENYKKSLDEQYGLIEVKLQGLGEPLINPDFFKMVHETVSRNIWVRTTTNGSLLDRDDNYKRMIDEKIDEIQVSIDGATKETFEKIRIGSDFNKVVENVKMMNEYAREKDEGWRTSCWMLVQEENIDEMEQLIDLAEYMKFKRLTYSIAIGSWGRQDWEENNKKKRVYDRLSKEYLMGLVEMGKRKGIEVTFWMGMEKYEHTEDHKRICNWLFSRAYISADMKVVPCCVISDPETAEEGDAFGFSDIWNGDKYVTLRNAHLSNNIPNMCKNCY